MSIPCKLKWEQLGKNAEGPNQPGLSVVGTRCLHIDLGLTNIWRIGLCEYRSKYKNHDLLESDLGQLCSGFQKWYQFSSDVILGENCRYLFGGLFDVLSKNKPGFIGWKLTHGKISYTFMPKRPKKESLWSLRSSIDIHLNTSISSCQTKARGFSADFLRRRKWSCKAHEKKSRC